MNLKMEVQIPSRAFFEIFKVKLKETENFLNLLQLRAEREKAQSAVLEEYREKCAPVFQEGKTVSSYMKVFNAPLKEEILEAVEHRDQVSCSFVDDNSPICLLQEWIDKNGNEGLALLKLAKKTVKKYENLVAQLKAERKNIQKKIEDLDLNLTCQGKYGGSLQQGDKRESTAAKKRRQQFESEEDRLRSCIERSFNIYKNLISEEIDGRTNFLKTMSVIRDQSTVLETRRLKVMTEAYCRYISLIESSEPLSPRRELVLHQMRSMASGMVGVNMNMFQQWSKEKTRYYNFELFTDDWSHHGLGIVTNNVPGVVIPANVQVVSESDKTDSSREERSGQSYEDNGNTAESGDDFQPTKVSDQSDQDTKHGSQQPERSRKDKQLFRQKEAETKESNGGVQEVTTKVGRNPGSRVKGETTSSDENVDTPAITHNKTSRRLMGPNPKSLNPPPKSSTDGWRATQTPLENLTLPVRNKDQAKRRSVNSSENESMRDGSQKSPVEDANTKGTKSPSSENVAAHLQMQRFTGTDHPYYTPGDPLDLETLVLPEDTAIRPEAPFKPMINNWMDPDVDPLDGNSSDHNLLSQFLNKTKSKFRKSKKVRKPKSPEIVDTGPVPFDFGCEDVDEFSTVVEPFVMESQGVRAPPSTPGTRQPVQKSKTAARSASDSSENGNRKARKAKHRAKVIKLCTIDSYQAKTEDEISFVSGQTVKMIHRENAEGMAYGYIRSSRLKKREYGYFPVSLAVQLVEGGTRPLSREVGGFFKKR